MIIKDWALEDRPREKMALKGKAALSDVELIAIILGSGSRDESAVELAKRIYARCDNNLQELGKLTIHDLMEFKGVGEAKAITLAAALELGRRRSNTLQPSRPKVTSSRDVYELMFPKLADAATEEFWVIHMNRSNHVTELSKLSIGGVSQTVVDTRVIFKEAVARLSSGLILCHNHPSGNLKPSEADITLTKRVQKIGELFNISILDHVIVTDSGYFSFSDEGVL